MRAALELVKATDKLRLLRQVEMATGRPWVTIDDLRHVIEATAEYTGSGHGRVAWKGRR